MVFAVPYTKQETKNYILQLALDVNTEVWIKRTILQGPSWDSYSSLVTFLLLAYQTTS